MRISTSMRWLVVAVSAAMLLAVVAACSSETIEVPGETIVVKEEVIKTVEVPGETVVKEVIKEVMVPGETVVVEKVVTETVEVPGETVVVEKEVVKTVEVPGETVTVEVVKEVQVPGETVVVEKVVTQTVQVPGETVVVEKEVVKTVEVPGETVVVEKEVVKTVEVAGPERVVVKEVRPGYVTDPSSGRVYVAPQYGGSITEAKVADAPHADTWWGSASREPVTLVLEKMGIADWATPRDKWDFKSYNNPTSVLRGLLAESYDISPDGLTYTVNIRKGVNWHDKPPMNGRELVADDIVFSFHRMTGTGSGFTEPSPHATVISNLPIESIEATDKYTVVFKLTKLHLAAFWDMYSSSNFGFIYPPEVIQEHGHAQDWRNLVGTGPYELTDWVKDSSQTFTKNPNYWGYDEKFPENRLPYLDEIKFLIIPDQSTMLAALRTGKNARLAFGLSLDQAKSLQRTNPELLWSTNLDIPLTHSMDVRKPPFDDIRVRTAMQLALDLETINNTLFGGRGDTTPYGIIGPARPGFYTPFEEWPQEIKDNYAYDPERAKQLLAEAGYPNGFKTKLETATTHPYYMNLDYTQLAVDMWSKIGVDVEIDIIEWAAYAARVNTHTYEGMVHGLRGLSWSPLFAIRIAAHSDHVWNMPGVQDPVYDAMVEAAENAGSTEELMELVKKADDYYIPQQWVTWGPMRPGFVFWQPWMVGYNGEIVIGGGRFSLYLSRVWLDSELKEAMGH